MILMLPPLVIVILSLVFGPNALTLVVAASRKGIARIHWSGLLERIAMLKLLYLVIRMFVQLMVIGANGVNALFLVEVA
jgi:hypothetical protein